MHYLVVSFFDDLLFLVEAERQGFELLLSVFKGFLERLLEVEDPRACLLHELFEGRDGGHCLADETIGLFVTHLVEILAQREHVLLTLS